MGLFDQETPYSPPLHSIADPSDTRVPASASPACGPSTPPAPEPMPDLPPTEDTVSGNEQANGDLERPTSPPPSYLEVCKGVRDTPPSPSLTPQAAAEGVLGVRWGGGGGGGARGGRVVHRRGFGNRCMSLKRTRRGRRCS